MKTVSKYYCIFLLLFIFYSQHLSAQLKADFSISSNAGCAPLYVHFTDASSGSPTEWEWDLGNGTISTVQHPGTLYLIPGTYTVKLVVKDSAGYDSVIKVDVINVYAKPDVQFTLSNNTGCAPLAVQFANSSTAGSGIIDQQIWDFGDGEISTDPNPLHIYKHSDTAAVVLTLINNYGCKQTLFGDSVIKVYSSVAADFNSSITNVCQPPTQANFTNISASDKSLTYSWLFGDGDSSVNKDPVHAYAAAGTFEARLIAKTTEGCIDTIVKNITVTTVTPDFAAPADNCINKPVVFTNNSLPAPVSASWTFGDGGTLNTVSGSHIYTGAGIFKVTMNSNFGSCTVAVTRDIVISPKPVPAFDLAGKLISCSLPDTVQFNNLSAGAVNYKWFFGDGDSSSLVNPKHIYKKAGNFTVKLLAFNINGCNDTLTKISYVQTGPPDIQSFQNLPIGACAPQTITTKANIQSPEPIVDYLWDFGDGFTSADSLPVHKYLVAGSYDVKLIAKSSGGCMDTFKLNNAVLLGNLSSPKFIVSASNICASATVQVTDQTIAFVSSWLWKFGDGTTSTVQNAAHLYRDTGNFSVTLRVVNNGCADSVTLVNAVHINPPVANFSITVVCKDNFSRNFIDNSIGAKSWKWDFGDGETSAEKSPTHTYKNTGTYTVILTSMSDTCSDIKTNVVTITNLIPSFTYTPTDPAICKNSLVTFAAKDYSSSPVSSFLWNYGDGITYSTSNYTVSNKYIKLGKFSPFLIITRTNTCKDTVYSPTSIVTYGPTSNFTNGEGACINQNFSFTDQSVPDSLHPVTKWVWIYGDNNTSTFTTLPFDHVYRTSGTYNVKLVVYDSFGCKDSITKNSAVIISKPIPAFSILDSIRCTGSAASFVNSSSGLLLKSFWDFGDSTNSSDTTPSHIYAQEGLYHVKLLVKDKFGCSDSLTKMNVIAVANPKASFSITDTVNLCPPILIQPINSSKNFTSAEWNFADGNSSEVVSPYHYYNIGGIYNIRLKVKGHGECYDSTDYKFTINSPYGTLKFTPDSSCNHSSVSFIASAKNTTDYIWDFNNGFAQKTSDSVVYYTYNNYGRYVPQLVLTNSTGCQVYISANDTITVADVHAGIRLTGQTSCDSSLINFMDSSIVQNDSISNYKWNFGDKSSSSLSNPSHYYKSSGTYNVSLQLTTDIGCTDTVTMPVTVEVYKSPQLSIAAPDSSCIYSTVDFKGTNALPDTALTWRWNMGNSTITDKQDASDKFMTAAVYNVQLSATDTHGCTDTALHKLNVIALPVTDAGANRIICEGDKVTLSPSGSNSSYQWSQDPSLSCTSCANPVANPATTTTYHVNAYNSFGCTSSDSVQLKVIIIPQVTSGIKITGHTGCDSSYFIFSDSSISKDVKIKSYKWNFGDNSSSLISNPSHYYKTSGTYNVSLQLTTDNGCSDTVIMPVTVEVYKSPQLSIAAPDSSCIYSAVNFKGINALADTALSWYWNMGNGNKADGQYALDKFTAAGIYNILLSATDVHGCNDTAWHKLNVIALPFTDAGANRTICEADKVILSPSGGNSYQWLSDPSLSCTSCANPVASASTTTTYHVNAYNSFGCTSSDSVQLKVIIIPQVTSGIRITGHTGCDSSYFIFSDSSISKDVKIKSYQWNFGDNSSSILGNPSHYYNARNTYNVSLQLTTDIGCIDTVAMPVTVEVYKSPQLSIAAPDSSCIYSTVDFKAAEINNVNLLSWHWDFGNGSTISSQNGSAKYQAAGKYDVVLSAIDGHGCVDSVLRKINVIALPAVNAGNDTIICSRDIITLHPSGAAVYNWSTNSSLSCTNCANPVAHPPFSTTYYLKGSNAFGCVASDTLHVQVKQSVRLSVQKLDSLCVGKSIQLNASGAESYQWLSAESLSNLNIPNPVVSAPVTTTYTLIGSNYTGCAADTALVTVKVFPLPQFNIVDTAITVNLGTSYKMNTIGSPDIVRWLWTPPVALSCNNCPSPIVQTIGDVVYKATVSTAVGCTASDYITVHTLCNGLNLFIPNTFSPNNDGNNDWFFPRGKGEFNVRSFSVFNKLGQLVYQKNNLSVNNERDGWNGNYYGSPAPTDVYFYSIEIICSNAHTFTMKGDISLIR